MSAIAVPRGTRRRGHEGFRPDPRRTSEITLQDRHELEEGRIFLSGIQALVRMAFDQRRRDERAGLNTATFVSGYQGSRSAGSTRSSRGSTGCASASTSRTCRA